MGEIERTDTARVFIGDSSRVEWAGWARDSLDLINKVGEIGPVYILQKASSCHTYPQFWVRPAKKNIWVQHVLMLHPRFGHGIPSCSVGKSLNVGLSDFIWTSLTNAHVSGVERVGQYDEVSAQFVGDRERKKKWSALGTPNFLRGCLVPYLSLILNHKNFSLPLEILSVSSVRLGSDSVCNVKEIFFLKFPMQNLL